MKNKPIISKDTLRKTDGAANQLDYHSNLFAGNLRSQQTDTIRVIIHRINRNYIAVALTGMEDVASKMEIRSILTISMKVQPVVILERVTLPRPSCCRPLKKQGPHHSDIGIAGIKKEAINQFVSPNAPAFITPVTRPERQQLPC